MVVSCLKRKALELIQHTEPEKYAAILAERPAKIAMKRNATDAS